MFIIKWGCLPAMEVLLLAEMSHHQVAPGSLSSGCCSVPTSCLRGTWARLHSPCSCLSSSSSAHKEMPLCEHFDTSPLTRTHSRCHDSRLPLCFLHYSSTWCPCSLGLVVQGSPRYGLRNPASAQSTASSPCQLDDGHSELIIAEMQSAITGALPVSPHFRRNWR